MGSHHDDTRKSVWSAIMRKTAERGRGVSFVAARWLFHRFFIYCHDQNEIQIVKKNFNSSRRVIQKFCK